MYNIELSTHKVQSMLFIGWRESAKRFAALFVLASSFPGLLPPHAYNDYV